MDASELRRSSLILALGNVLLKLVLLNDLLDGLRVPRRVEVVVTVHAP